MPRTLTRSSTMVTTPVLFPEKGSLANPPRTGADKDLFDTVLIQDRKDKTSIILYTGLTHLSLLFLFDVI